MTSSGRPINERTLPRLDQFALGAGVVLGMRVVLDLLGDDRDPVAVTVLAVSGAFLLIAGGIKTLRERSRRLRAGPPSAAGP